MTQIHSASLLLNVSCLVWRLWNYAAVLVQPSLFEGVAGEHSKPTSVPGPEYERCYSFCPRTGDLVQKISK